MKRPPTVDPIEKIVADAMTRNKVRFVEEPDPICKRLDFYLPDYDVYIEVKQFHAERIAEQMGRVDNIIAIQGEGAAKMFARILDLRSRC